MRPYFVDALLGIFFFFSGSCLGYAGAVWMRWAAMVYGPLEEGWVGRPLVVVIDALGAW